MEIPRGRLETDAAGVPSAHTTFALGHHRQPAGTSFSNNSYGRMYERCSHRHDGNDSGAFSWVAVHEDGPAQAFRPFSHTDQTKAALGIRQPNRAKSAAVVVDTQLDMVFPAEHFNVNLHGV